MKLIYIYHSGFAIESDNWIIIIDYFQDSINKKEGIVHDDLLKKNKKKYVLSSHSHADHFNPEILKWKFIDPSITYIFSKDILDENKAKPEDAIYLDKLDKYEDNLLSVEAFGSTDIGISFLIKIDHKTLFHAGDLNNWHWNEEAEKKEILAAEQYYEEELNILANHVNHISLAMFPIDPRLGKDYMKGAEQFINSIKVDIFAPMHFGTAYKKIAAFKEIAEKKSCKCICWKKRGEIINL